MPNNDTTSWDGHSSMVGVDTKTSPSELAAAFSSGAVNRKFRGGINSTRPPIQSKRLVFSTEEDEQEFKFGNIAGAIAYRKVYKNTQPHIVVAAGRKILKGRMYADVIEFDTLYNLKTPEYINAWFVQGEDRLYYQNDVDDPVGWDGKNPAYVIEGGIANDKMPIGNIMVYIHGRLVVFTSNNHALISDHIYGNTLIDTSGLESFIEIQAFNDIGAIPTPSLLGDIVGAVAIPLPGTKDAQGDLLIIATDGAYTLNIAGLREDWLFGGIQAPVLVGVGGASQNSIVPANNDIWFRTSEGRISTYKFERSEQDREWGNTSLSREVDQYLNYDTDRNLQHCSSILAHNRLITSCAIKVIPNSQSGYGHHKFGQGMVSLDFDRGSTVNQRPGFAWDGLWTGVNPVQFLDMKVDGSKRPLIISHDEDGENRIYEFMKDGFRGSDMADGTRKSIVSFYETPYLFKQSDPKQNVILKRMTGGMAMVSQVDQKASVDVLYRPNDYPCWAPFSGRIEIGSDPPQLTEPTDQARLYKPIYWGSPNVVDGEEASPLLLSRAFYFSLRIEIEGDAEIKMLQVSSEVAHKDHNTCREGYDDVSLPKIITCPSPGLFEYKIVT